MSTFIGLLLLLAAGWLLVKRTGLARGDLLYDVSLSWFIGSGYFSLAYIIAIALRCPVRPLVSFAIISIPFLLLLKGAGGDLRTFRASAAAAHGILRGSAKALLPSAPLVLLALIAIAIMALQGVSAPPVADDVVRVRLARPIEQYFAGAVPLKLGFVNGIWANYVPQLFWHIGGLNLFTVQYMALYTVIFGLILIFQSLVLDKRYRAAAYAVFIPTALPFFVFHGTTSNLDIIVACFFGLGFFFFQEFTRKENEKTFYTAIIFFTLTALAKNSANALTFIGIAFLAAALYAHVQRGGRVSVGKTVLFFLPLLIYLVLKNTTQSSSQFQGVLNQTSSPSWKELLPGVWYSLFSSGHFGILFYTLGMSIVIFFRKIFLTRHKWGFALLMTALASMVAYYLFVFNDLPSQQAQISRAMLTPAVATALFLASLWGDEAGE